MIAPFSETGGLGSTGLLLSAPLIGLAFGWFLERGGLGCAPKLAGQFFFSDLTVFKVFFTAILTAMLGAFWLDRFGLLDLSLVNLPETSVLPQAIGGALFGVGFLVAGLCPGTSCVAAASGRLDGLAVMGGMLAGIVVFNSAFDWIEPLYRGTPLGAIRFSDWMGISTGAGVALITAIALCGFALVGRFERSRVSS